MGLIKQKGSLMQVLASHVVLPDCGKSHLSFGKLNTSESLLSTSPSMILHIIFYSHSVFYSKSMCFRRVSGKFSFMYWFYIWCFWLSFYFYCEHFPIPVFCDGLLLHIRGQSSALLQQLQFVQRMTCAEPVISVMPVTDPTSVLVHGSLCARGGHSET